VKALLGPPGAPVEPPPGEVEVIYADITDLHALRSLVDGADLVAHLAGSASVAASFEQPIEYARVHVVGTATLLEACRATSVNRIVHISSAELYGQPDRNPVREDLPVAPLSPYGAAKLGAESMVRALAPVLSVDATILRPFSVYGPGLPLRSLVGTVIQQALFGDSVVVADLAPIRDYCFLDDVVEAIVAACYLPLPSRIRTYNIGSGKGVAVGELVNMVLAQVARDIPVIEASRSDRPIGASVTQLVADPHRAAEELQWKALTSLKDGLALTIDWVRRMSDGNG
jgi:UDP-glucose 4-epimerase